MTSPDELNKVLTRAWRLYASSDDEDGLDDFIFHMQDWLEDLEAIRGAYDGSMETEEAAETIFSFMIHAVPHLWEAQALLLGTNFTPFRDRDEDDERKPQ